MFVILPIISDFIFSTYKKIKSETFGKISDFIFLNVEKINLYLTNFTKIK